MKRSNLEMEIDILRALSRTKSLRVTHIMYRANVNFTILKDKLSSLEEKGLVKAQRLHRAHLAGPGKEFAFYQITVEGLNVVHSYALLTAKLGRVD